MAAGTRPGRFSGVIGTLPGRCRVRPGRPPSRPTSQVTVLAEPAVMGHPRLSRPTRFDPVVTGRVSFAVVLGAAELLRASVRVAACPYVSRASAILGIAGHPGTLNGVLPWVHRESDSWATRPTSGCGSAQGPASALPALAAQE
ncbi:MAG: hypothetical protein ACREQ5_40910 [Candidatus Dormibacteria bacterium]